MASNEETNAVGYDTRFPPMCVGKVTTSLGRLFTHRQGLPRQHLSTTSIKQDARRFGIICLEMLMQGSVVFQKASFHHLNSSRLPSKLKTHASVNVVLVNEQLRGRAPGVIGLSSNEIASKASIFSNTWLPPFVRKSRPPSQVPGQSSKDNAVFPQLEGKKQLITDSDETFCISRNRIFNTTASRKMTTLRFRCSDQHHEGVNVGTTEDGLKVENVSLKRRYDELSKANTHSRTAYTEKLSAFTAENTKLKAQVNGKTSSGPSTSETPKVLASGIYNVGSKYIPPPKRAN
ncbi:hypothetical protein Tco_1286284, partial [Tanacetum coccineum]